MDCLTKVLEKLKVENIVPSINAGIITWLENFSEKYFIELNNFDCLEDNIAWFQSNNNDMHLLRIFNNGEQFDWEPITHNSSFGCECHLLEWYKGHLVFVYQEKHDVYICSFKNKLMKLFKFYGERLERKGDIFLFETYATETNNIRRIQIPDLNEIDSIPRELAEKEGLLPKTLDISFGMILKNR